MTVSQQLPSVLKYSVSYMFLLISERGREGEQRERGVGVGVGAVRRLGKGREKHQ